MDSALDPKHPALEPRLSADYGRPLFRRRWGEAPISLAQLNAELREDFVRGLQGLTRSEIELIGRRFEKIQIEADPACLDRLTAAERGELERTRRLLQGRSAEVERITGSTTATAHDIGLLHATHVGSLLARDLHPGSKLLHIPYVTRFVSPQSWNYVRYFATLQGTSQKLHQMFSSGRIRVMNVSAGLVVETPASRSGARDPFWLLGPFLGVLPSLGAPLLDRAVNLLRTDEVHLRSNLFEALRGLAIKHPETVFVFSAGNMGRDLSDLPQDFAHIRLPNTITVAALDLEGNIGPFSNFSTDHVDIAAPGTCVLGARAGGGWIRMSGTSQAAPRVANRLARILESTPDLDGAGAIERLFKDGSLEDVLLEYSVRAGRVLR